MDPNSRVSAYRARRQGSVDYGSTPRHTATAATPMRATSYARNSRFPPEDGGIDSQHDEGRGVAIKHYGSRHDQHQPQHQQHIVTSTSTASTAPNDLTTYILELEAQNRELRQHIVSLQEELAAATTANVGANNNSININYTTNSDGGRRPSSSSISMGNLAEGRLRDAVGEEGARAIAHTINRTASIAGGSRAANGIGMLMGFASEAEKKAFLTDILSQIEVVIQAHRNKTQSEISRYKAEAESARETLRALREVIQSEGMDLTLAPSLLNTQRTFMSLMSSGGAVQSGDLALLRADAADLAIPQECDALLNGISQDMVRRLVALGDEPNNRYSGGGNASSSSSSGLSLPSLVKEEVKRGFVTIVKHFSQQLVMASKDSAAALADQRAEAERMRDELRTQLHMSEERRLAMVKTHDIELTALRDELHAFNVAASEDEVEQSLHQRALEEYNRMLVESRMETATLRKAIEDEKNHSAEVCLRLKTALQRRSAEFEKTIVEQAESLVKERDDAISKLQEEVKILKGPPKVFSSVSCQAGESFVVPVDADNYVTNVLKAMKRDPRSVGENNAQYERDLWRHTQELIQRYGGVLPGGTNTASGGGSGGSAAHANQAFSAGFGFGGASRGASGGAVSSASFQNVSQISRQSSQSHY